MAKTGISSIFRRRVTQMKRLHSRYRLGERLSPACLLSFSRLLQNPFHPSGHLISLMILFCEELGPMTNSATGDFPSDGGLVQRQSYLIASLFQLSKGWSRPSGQPISVNTFT